MLFSGNSNKGKFKHDLGELSVSLPGRLTTFVILALIVTGLIFTFIFFRHSKDSSSSDFVGENAANVQTVKNSDGTVSKKIYTAPVNYKDAQGKWKKIDTNIKTRGSKLEVTKAPYKVFFESNVKGKVAFSVGNKEISFAPKGLKSSKAKIRGNKATYQNVFTNTDLERIATSSGLKQNYILKAKGHPDTFKETLTTSLKPKLTKNGAINFYDRTKIIARAPAPYLTDAKGVTRNFKYTVSSVGANTSELIISLPSLKGLSYPIMVDPTITIPQYKGDPYYPEDTYVNSYLATSNYSTWTTFWVGKRGDGFNYGDTFSLIKFPDLSLVPAGSTINDAKLYLYNRGMGNYAGSGGSIVVQLQSIDSTWAASSVTWNTKPQYGDYLGDTKSSFFASYGSDPWDVTQLVSEWLNNDRVNNGLALVKISGTDWTYATFSSSDYTASRYPYLEINYTAPPPDPTPPTSNITDPTHGSFIPISYTISGTASDNAGGTGLKKVEVSTNGGSTWIQTNLNLGSGTWSYDWTAPAEGDYTIKSRATDNADNVETPGVGIDITVDNANPTAAITSPAPGAALSGSFDLVGTADDANFKDYKVEYGEGASPANWTKIGSSMTMPVINDVLKTIDFGAGNGQYTFKITVTDDAGNTSNASVTVDLDNPVPESPHANYTQDPDQCAICHRAHTATVNGLINGKGTVYQANFCYTCHDGTGSIYNVKAAYDTNPSHNPIADDYYLNQATYPDSSGHQKSDHVLICTQCHDPHGTKKPDGTYYPKLLKAKNGGNEYYEGNEFCGVCHGPGTALIGGDHLTDFTSIPHNTLAPNPLSGTKIKCLNCHGNNNSSGNEGTAPHGSDFNRVTKLNEEEVCFQCHDNAENSENNINISQILNYPLSIFTDEASMLSARHSVADSEQVDADPDTAGNQSSKVECEDCHNPHKNDRGDKKIANPDNVFDLFTGTRPDPKLWDYESNKGFAIFMPFYRQRAQDVGVNNYTYTYEGPQTPADGQDTHIDSSKPGTILDHTAALPVSSPDGSDGVRGPYNEWNKLRVVALVGHAK